MRVLSIFAIAIFMLLGACASPSSKFRAQPNVYGVVEGYQPQEYANANEHVIAVFKNLATIDGVSTIPSNAIFSVSWDLIPGDGYRKAERRNCQFHIKDVYSATTKRYPCLDVSLVGGEYIVGYQVGQGVEELNLSHLRGEIIQGVEHEPFNFLGLRWTYGSSYYQVIPVRWSTNRPVSWDRR